MVTRHDRPLPLVGGGQGKSGQQISDDTFWFCAFLALCGVVAVGCVCMVW